MRERAKSKVSPGAEAVCFNASGEKQAEKSPELVKPTRGPLMLDTMIVASSLCVCNAGGEDVVKEQVVQRYRYLFDNSHDYFSGERFTV